MADDDVDSVEDDDDDEADDADADADADDGNKLFTCGARIGCAQLVEESASFELGP